MKVSSFNEMHSGYLRCPPYPQTPDDQGLSPAGPVLDHPSLHSRYSVTHPRALLAVFRPTSGSCFVVSCRLSLTFSGLMNKIVFFFDS